MLFSTSSCPHCDLPYVLLIPCGTHHLMVCCVTGPYRCVCTDPLTDKCQWDTQYNWRTVSPRRWTYPITASGGRYAVLFDVQCGTRPHWVATIVKKALGTWKALWPPVQTVRACYSMSRTRTNSFLWVLCRESNTKKRTNRKTLHQLPDKNLTHVRTLMGMQHTFPRCQLDCKTARG
jgi:hypothetical protein